jgi:hypothetical protein
MPASMTPDHFGAFGSELFDTFRWRIAGRFEFEPSQVLWPPAKQVA